MGKKERKILVCPICGGPLTSWLGFRGGLIYSCKKCGYRGPLTVKTSKEDSDRMRKRYDEKRKIN